MKFPNASETLPKKVEACFQKLLIAFSNFISDEGRMDSSASHECQ